MAIPMKPTGRAVAWEPMARPAMMFVACPVSEAFAIFRTGE
jgi:hypothetical protein